ncbi:CD63 antigen-like [Mizuhopecten yessoensis]|uniref:Tetraspanin n=1 Tax=Mizuhopecten yessoensis TaxID=6573 RepID=A0A210QUK2_MIZYE|nr:CD63 antigen-like [Mizuhopecten yessoensis]OWF52421.1 Tetraspanin-7 [Mizuhopecten yessoensis]
MVCCTQTISKYVIVILNIVFMVLGIAIMIPGILMLTSIDFLSDNIKPLLDKISVNGLDLANIANSLPVIFIIVGLTILCIAAIGLIGACCELRILLAVYGIIVLVLALAQVVILAFFFILRTGLTDTIKDAFLSQLRDGYTLDSLDKSDEVSSSFNYMFMTMECCGVNPVTSTSNDFDGTPWRSGTGSALELPKGCCIGVTESTYSSYSNAACTTTVASGTYWSTGCYDAIMSSFGSLLDSMGYILLIALLLQLLMVFFAFNLCCSIL